MLYVYMYGSLPGNWVVVFQYYSFDTWKVYVRYNWIEGSSFFPYAPPPPFLMWVPMSSSPPLFQQVATFLAPVSASAGTLAGDSSNIIQLIQTAYDVS